MRISMHFFRFYCPSAGTAVTTYSGLSYATYTNIWRKETESLFSLLKSAREFDVVYRQMTKTVINQGNLRYRPILVPLHIMDFDLFKLIHCITIYKIYFFMSTVNRLMENGPIVKKIGIPDVMHVCHSTGCGPILITIFADLEEMQIFVENS